METWTLIFNFVYKDLETGHKIVIKMHIDWFKKSHKVINNIPHFPWDPCERKISKILNFPSAFWRHPLMMSSEPAKTLNFHSFPAKRRVMMIVPSYFVIIFSKKNWKIANGVIVTSRDHVGGFFGLLSIPLLSTWHLFDVDLLNMVRCNSRFFPKKNLISSH